MKKASFVWFLLAVLLAGCAKIQEAPRQTEAPVRAEAYYTSGRKTVESAENLMLQYTLEETRTVGDNTFTKQITGKSSYQDYCGSEMLSKVEETLDFGYYRCHYEESFFGKRAYAAVNDCYFWTTQSAGAFVSRQLPSALLTPELYGTVTYGQTENIVLFSEPRGLEAWVGEGELLTASGEAVLDGEGTLQQTRYQARYRKGETDYTLSVTVQITLPKQLDLSGVQRVKEEKSVWLSDLNTPRKLVQVVADVYSAQSISCVLSETITSEAIPLSYERSSQIRLKGRGADLLAELVNTSKLSNNRGVVTETSQTERFENQVYTVWLDGGEPVKNGNVTADAMRQYGEDTMLSGLLAVKYLRSASLRRDGNLLCLELGGNLEFRDMLNGHLQEVLQVDLDALADASEYHGFSGYLTIDPETGLPVEYGMFLEKSHTMDGVEYRLSYHLEETLTFA